MSQAPLTYWLSMHIPYACRHSGVCCSSGWPIPVERSRVEAFRPLAPRARWLLPAPGGGGDVAGVLALSDSGHCLFHRSGIDGCAVHRTLGHAALPTACQHFPRQVLLDPRGVFVSLSHYCPTAADLLFNHVGPVEIVEGPPAIPQGNPEGLDARDVLPPVLVGAGVGPARRGQARPGEEARVALLMDLDGYSAWEAHMVHALTTSSAPPEAVLPSLEADFRLLQQWRPGHRTLAAEVAALRDRDRAAADRAGLAPVSTDDRVLGRYLAARAFASWAAYQGGGVAAVLAELRRALALVRELSAELPLKEAIRQADWQLLHVDA